MADAASPRGAATDVHLLRDGTPLVVRPIRRADAPALVALHARLSSGTIRRRYFGARPTLAPAVVDRFTRVDEGWRFALVAVREPDDLVAVARYEGHEGARSAELALVVDDALQHQGLGRALLRRLLHVARERGLEAIDAEVLLANAPMLALLRGIGLPSRTVRDADTVTVTLDLTALRLHDDDRARARAHIAASRPAPPVLP